MNLDEKFMKMAITQAKKAEAILEVPIGCVIVREGKVIARGYNKRNSKKNTLAHAEIIAINKASKAVGDWRLEGCTMYVTLEPCPMCAGAIINSRLPAVIIGAADPKAGAMGSIADMCALPLNHKPEVVFGVLEEECAGLLRRFFREKRERGERWKK